MLHSINLLPWREAKKRAHKKRFTHLMVLGVVVASFFQWLGSWYLDGQHDIQQQRIDFLNQHIATLDKRISALKQAERQYRDLTSRLATVESLQIRRNKTTELMDLIPQLIPQGVYVDQMSMNGHAIEMSGISDSTARLATMLDLLENAPLISEVEIHSIVSGSFRFDKQFQSFKVSFLFEQSAMVENAEVSS